MPLAFDASLSPILATGSSNVYSFRWQPNDPAALQSFLFDIADFGSAEYASIAGVAHGDGTLEVTFRNGSTYQYSPLSRGLFVEMLNAPSRGHFVAEELKRRGVPFIGPV